MREIKFRAWDKSEKYEISDDGQVFSNDYNHTGNRKELRQYLDRDGYPYVFLIVEGKRYKRKVHRLVAEYFLEKSEIRTHVNHKNGIRNDNRIENLEWVTHQENVIHGWRTNGRKHSDEFNQKASNRISGESNPKAKLTQEKAEEIRKLRQSGESLKSISERYKIGLSQVSAIAKGKFWSSVHEHPHLLTKETT